MANWRQLGSIWQLRPAEPAGLVEFIGGSYLAATPQISYRRLLEELAADGLACLLYTSPSPRDVEESRMPSSA